MPRSATIYRVFVASPSDVTEEREAAKQVIARVNKQLSRIHRIQLEYIGWDTDVTPSIGDDSQDAINQQINDNYDIFLGILGSKFGTPTKRAESGTSEEFFRALDNFEHGRCVKVMVYFRKSSIPMNNNALAEAKRIVDFQEELANKGALYGEFENTTDFSHTLQMHLYDVAVTLEPANNESGTTDNSETQFPSTVHDFDENSSNNEDGIFDLIEAAETYFDRVTDITEKMSDTMGRFNKAVTERANQAKLLGTNKDISNRQRRNFADSSASDFETFTREMQSLVPELQDNYEIAIQSAIRALQMADEDEMVDEQDRQEAVKILNEQWNAIYDTRFNIIEFRKTIQSLPRMTQRFNRAKRTAAESLDGLNSFFEVSEKTLQEVISRYSRD